MQDAAARAASHTRRPPRSPLPGWPWRGVVSGHPGPDFIAQWQGHKPLSAAPVGLVIISVPLTIALIGFVLYAAWSKQPGGAPLGLSRAVAPTGAVAPIQVAAPIAEATPPPPAPVAVASPA